MIISLRRGLTTKLKTLISLMASKHFYDIKILWQNGLTATCIPRFEELFSNNFENIAWDYGTFAGRNETEEGGTWIADFEDVNNTITGETIIESVDYGYDNRHFIAGGCTILLNDTKQHYKSYRRLFRNYLIDMEPHRYAKALTPNDKLQEYIDKHSKLIDEGTYAVHVRIGAGINYNSTAIYSPIEEFERKISEIIKEDKYATFFVVSDHQLALDRLYFRFPDHVYHIDGFDLDGPRALDSGTTFGGGERAVIDLYTAAKCKKLLCPPESNYSTYLAILAGMSEEDVTFVCDQNMYDKLSHDCYRPEARFASSSTTPVARPVVNDDEPQTPAVEPQANATWDENLNHLKDTQCNILEVCGEGETAHSWLIENVLGEEGRLTILYRDNSNNCADLENEYSRDRIVVRDSVESAKNVKFIECDTSVLKTTRHRQWADKYDFIYISKTDNIGNDLENCLPTLKENGIICIDVDDPDNENIVNASGSMKRLLVGNQVWVYNIQEPEEISQGGEMVSTG